MSNLVLFISWPSYEYETQCRNDGKIHVGRRTVGRSIDSFCQTHWSKHIPERRAIVVSAKNYPVHRFCKFCLNNHPEVYGLSKPIKSKTVVQDREAVKPSYVLIYRRPGTPGYDYMFSAVLKGGTIEAKLKREPKLLKDLQNNVARLLRVYPIGVEYKTEEIVKSLEFKE